MGVVDGVEDAEVTTVRGFRALSGLGRSPGVHLSSSRRWGAMGERGVQELYIFFVDGLHIGRLGAMFFRAYG